MGTYLGDLTTSSGLDPQFLKTTITDEYFVHNASIESIVDGPIISRIFADTSISANVSLCSQSSFGQIESLDMILAGVYAVLLLVTIAGNLLVIAAFFKDPQLQAIANYWIVSLSLTDVILALSIIPLQIHQLLTGQWTLGDLSCDLFIMFDVLSCTCSIYHLMLISLDRYLCVCFPIRYQSFRTSTRTIAAILATWLFSAVLSSPRLLGWKDAPEPCSCTMSNFGYRITSSVVSFYLPLFLIMCMYVGIYRWTQRRNRRFQNAKNNTHAPSGLLPTLSQRQRDRVNSQTTAVHSKTHDGTAEDSFRADGEATGNSNTKLRLNEAPGVSGDPTPSTTFNDLVERQYDLSPSTKRRSADKDEVISLADDFNLVSAHPGGMAPGHSPIQSHCHDLSISPTPVRKTSSTAKAAHWVRQITSTVRSPSLAADYCPSSGQKRKNPSFAERRKSRTPESLAGSSMIASQDSVSSHESDGEDPTQRNDSNRRQKSSNFAPTSVPTPDAVRPLKPKLAYRVRKSATIAVRVSRFGQSFRNRNADNQSTVRYPRITIEEISRHLEHIDSDPDVLKHEYEHAAADTKAITNNNNRASDERLTDHKQTDEITRLTDKQVTIDADTSSASHSPAVGASAAIYRRSSELAARKAADIKRTLTRRRQRQDNRTARVVVIVIGAFVLFWAPFFICNVIEPLSLVNVPVRVWGWITMWGYVNSACNPLIYTCFNRTFRRAILNVIKCRKHRTRWI